MSKQFFRIHPIMIPFLLFFILEGEIAIYAIVFSSLIFHELGHLLGAKLVGGRVSKCTILPYGGEIKIEQFSKWKKGDQLIVILGGPFFSMLVLIMSLCVSFPQSRLVTYTQLAILLINLLPIYPLDGGRILYTLFPTRYITIISLSIWISFSIFYISLFYFPKTIFLSILFFFLFIQNINFWRFRRYKLAYDRLTKSA